MNELGKLLRDLRGRKSLREAAEKAGISHNYLSIVEKGVDPRSGSPINPTPETLMSLSKAYDYPYEELMKVAGYLPAEEQEIDQRHPAQILREFIEQGLTNEQLRKRGDLYVAFLALNDDQTEEFLNFAREQIFKNLKQSTAAVSESEEP